MKKTKNLLILVTLFALCACSFAKGEEEISSISIHIPSNSWHFRVWPNVAIIGYGSGMFETARVERPDLLRELYKEIKPAIDMEETEPPVGTITGAIEIGDKMRQFYIKDEALIKNAIDVLAVNWKPADKVRFADLLARKPIFKDWTPSPERGKEIIGKMSW